MDSTLLLVSGIILVILLLVSGVILVETDVRISGGSCMTNESMTVSISGLCKLAGPFFASRFLSSSFWNSMDNCRSKIRTCFITFVILQISLRHPIDSTAASTCEQILGDQNSWK